MGRGLQRADLSGVGHRSRVVEHERDAQPRCAPLGSGRRSQVEGVVANNLREIGLHLRIGSEHDLGAAIRGVGHVGLDVLGF